MKYQNKLNIIFFIVVFLFIISFFLSTFNYIRSSYVLKFLDELDPGTNITGLIDFTFSESNLNITYFLTPSSPNLGTTGKVTYDCISGICDYVSEYYCADYSYDYDYSFDDDYIYGWKNSLLEFDKNNSDIRPIILDRCESSYSSVVSGCSQLCAQTLDKNVGKKCCYDDIDDYDDGDVTYVEDYQCEREPDESENDKKNRLCRPDNIIYFWKGFFYDLKNQIKTDYFKSAIGPNETCPEGKKQCGILDDYGNKLCLKINSSCPINFLSTNISEFQNFTNYTKKNLSFTTVYYTNESTSSRIIDGFHVDTDLMRNYTDENCPIIDTDSITFFLYRQGNRLYKNTFDYDPNKEYDINSRAYLRVCYHGAGKNRSLEEIKELSEENERNATFNNFVIDSVKIMYTVSYFIELGGYILLCLLISLLYFVYLSECNQCNYCFVSCLDMKGFGCILSILIFAYLIKIAGSIVNMCSFIVFDFEGYDNLDKSMFNSYKVINIIGFSTNILLLVFIVVLLCLLSKIGINDSDRQVISGQLIDPQYANSKDFKNKFNKYNINDF